MQGWDATTHDQGAASAPCPGAGLVPRFTDACITLTPVPPCTSQIYSSFASYRENHDLVVVEGPSLGGGEVDAQIAAALSAPVSRLMLRQL
jgi:hypothetical protein